MDSDPGIPNGTDEIIAAGDMNVSAANVNAASEWMSVPEAARELLGIGESTLYRWISNKYGPPVYELYGGHKYKRSEVEGWIKQRQMVFSDPLFCVVGVVEASQMLNIHEKTLYRWINQAKGPPTFLFNGKYVFKKVDIEKWLAEQGQEALANVD